MAYYLPTRMADYLLAWQLESTPIFRGTRSPNSRCVANTVQTLERRRRQSRKMVVRRRHTVVVYLCDRGFLERWASACIRLWEVLVTL
jgi:hypothetical protein